MRNVILFMLGALVAFGGVAFAETTRIEYSAAVLGAVEVGTVSYEVTTNEGAYSARANVRTSGLARLFDQTEITASSAGQLRQAAVAWSSYSLSHAYANKFRRVSMTRTGAGVDTAIEPRFGSMGDPPATAAQQFSAYDPLSGVFALGRQVGAAGACQGRVLVFDGRQHYELALSPMSRGSVNRGGYNGPALACAMRYRPISGFTLSAAEIARIPEGEAWFVERRDGGFAAPLRLSVNTPLGVARLDMTRYSVS